jgi:hypothetical protein
MRGRRYDPGSLGGPWYFLQVVLQPNQTPVHLLESIFKP